MLDGETMVAETTAIASEPSGGGEGAVETVEQPLGDEGVQQPTTEVTAEQPVQPEAQPEEVIPEGASPPDWIKAHFADPQHGKDAQRLWDGYNAFRQQFGTIAEAKAAKEIISSVGSLDELKSAIEAANEKQNSDFVYSSADPAQHEAMARDWAESDPKAFATLTQAGIKVLAESQPEAYQELGQQILTETLASLQATAHRIGNKDAADRIEQVARDIFGHGLNEPKRVDPRDAKYAAKDKEYAEREQKAKAELVTNFAQSANTQVGTQVAASIDAMLKTALAGVKITDAARGKIASEVYSSINEKLVADKGLQTRLQAIGQAGKLRGQFSQQDTQQWVNAIQARAKALLPTVAKQVVEQWTKDYLGVVKDKTAKITGAANRKDITGGGAPDLSTGPLTLEKLKGMTNQQLMDYPGVIPPDLLKQLRASR